MIKSEWKGILHNWWFLLVLIVICIIPTIYTSIFLGSMWDPYGNTKHLNVALINHDHAVTYQGETLQIGNTLCENLLENDNMHFVLEEDENVAKDKLKDGTYAMIITIPSDFSKHATTLLDNQPKKMELTYTTNPGNNYVASKMDETAIQNIQKSVSEEVTKTYAKTIFSSMQEIIHGLQQTSEGTVTLNNGLTQLANGSSTLSNNLQVLANSTLTLKNGSVSLEKGLMDYTDGAMQIHQGIYSLDEGLTTLHSSLPTLSNGVTSLHMGASSLANGIHTYTNALHTIYQGNTQLANNSAALQNAVQAMGNASNQLVKGNQTITDGLSSLSNSLNQALSQNQQEAMKKVLNQNAQISTVLEQEKQLATSSASSIQDASNSISQLEQLLTDASIETMNEDDLRSLLLNVKQQVQQTSDTSQKAFTQAEQVNTMLLGTEQENTSVLENTQKLLSVNTSIVQQLSTGLKDVQAIVQGGTLHDQTVIPTGLLDGSKQVQSGLTQLHNSIQSENAADTTLSSSLNAYVQGVSQVQNGLASLDSSSNKLVSGSAELQAGTQQLKDQTPTLTSGITALHNGSKQLVVGSNSLVANNAALLSGSDKLSNGADQLQNGSNQLYNGSLNLKNGLEEANSGVSTLATTLSNKVQNLSLSSTDKTYDMMASPVTLDHQEVSTVENNGNAMAPYMMSVALYVAAMAFTLMYPLLKNISASKSGFQYWLAKASVMYGVSTVAAILMIGLLMLINGLSPAQTAKTFLFAILVSAAFMSMIMFFNIALGRIGEFLMLIFMVINLGGSAGTYPLETSPKLYQILHPFVPYTYSVNGFRHLLSMENADVTQEIMVFVGMIIIFATLSILYYGYRRKHPEPLLKEAFPEE